jgi:hypothetical protein
LKIKLFSLLVAFGLMGTVSADATPVQWLLQGTLTTVTGSGVPSGINPGDAFSFILHFDTSTPVSNPAACGTGGVNTTCRHNGDPNEYFSNIVVGSFGPVDLSPIMRLLFVTTLLLTAFPQLMDTLSLQTQTTAAVKARVS